MEKKAVITYYNPVQLSGDGHDLTREGILKMIDKWYAVDDEETVKYKWTTEFDKGYDLMDFIKHSLVNSTPKEFFHLMTNETKECDYEIFLSDGFPRHEDIEINDCELADEGINLYYFLTVYKVESSGNLPF